MSLRCQDDKLLGEKVHNYCSSSEDEREDESVSEDEKEQVKGEENTVAQQPTMKEHNTGPKGVIEDWKAFKNNEHLKRQQEEMKKKEMIKVFFTKPYALCFLILNMLCFVLKKSFFS